MTIWASLLALLLSILEFLSLEFRQTAKEL